MGCTSSAPNMATTNQNATEKILEFSDDEGGPTKKNGNEISTSEENGKNEIKVLPCDTLADPIQLDSNNKSNIDSSDMKMDKDIPTTTADVLETETKAKEKDEDLQIKEKMSLEDVVEKVVELYVADALAKSTPDVTKPADKIDVSVENTKEENTNEDRISVKIDECETEPSEEKEEPLEEALSPSQSTSSRATRWEALADIAAELPPSLTVDPLTGQIYALSK
ncbi:hypothetical protein ABMA28_004581 [Loxostege sticticalis]|uniref:Uncharacterized protein n=1 Tax=Loxostege sticticalis TaxID=481309 RepID=A0ABD0SRR7_LOXSC